MWTDDLTDLELSPSSSIWLSFCRSSGKATITVQLLHKHPPGDRIATKQLIVLVNLPNTRWLLSMAVRRVCSKMASRSNVRAFLPGGNKDSSLEQLPILSAYHKRNKISKLLAICAGQYIPNPENPMTDAMSPSPLILPDAAKEASKVFMIAWVILFIMKTAMIYRMQLSWLCCLLCKQRSFNYRWPFSKLRSFLLRGEINLREGKLREYWVVKAVKETLNTQ